MWNRTPERADELVRLGAKLCNTKKEIAESADIFITMVTAGENVSEILFGHDGIALSLSPGSIVIDMSTIGVEWALRIASELDKK